HRFILTTPEGTRYIFGTLEEEPPASNSGIEVSTYTGIQSHAVVPTSWYLRRIESVDRRHSITLEYQEERYTYLSPGSCSITYSSAGNDHNTGGSRCGPIPYGQENTGVSETLMNSKRLSKITHSSGIFTVHFLARNDREDISRSLRPTAKRLDLIEIVPTNDPCTKRFVFNYDYFLAKGSGAPENSNKPEYKRLRLNSLQESSCDVSIPPYVFSYHPGNLPHRISKAIDHWGFFNGAYGNEGTLNVPATAIPSHYGTYFSPNLGNVNRESHEASMKIGTLKTITYPMGGSTTFQFEANRVRSYENQTTNAPIFSLSNCNEPSASCCENAGFKQEGTFTFTEEQLEEATYSLSILNLTDQPPLPYNPFAFCQVSQTTPVEASLLIFDAAGNGIGTTSLNIEAQQTSGSKPKLGEPFIPLADLEPIGGFQAGVPYTFVIYASGGKASFNIFATSSQLVPTERIVGGLRIKEITKYDGLSHDHDIRRTFLYTAHSNSTESSGRLYYEPSYYGFHYDVFGSARATLIQSSPVTPMGNFQGNHIGYRRVVEGMEGNGYTEHLFTIEPNIKTLTDSYPYSPQEFLAKDGKPYMVKTYKQGSGEALQTIRYESQSDLYTYIPGNMYKAYQTVVSQAGGGSNTYYSFKPYKIRTAPYRIRKETRILDQVTASTSYEYDAQKRHLFPTKTITTNSDGRIMEERVKYPAEYVHSLAFGEGSQVRIQDLLDLHMIGVPVETQQWEGREGSMRMTGGQIQVYDNFSQNGFPLLKPTKIFLFEGAALAEEINNEKDLTTHQYTSLQPKEISANYQERASFHYESTLGNLVEQSLTLGTPIAYKWNQAGTRILAEVVGKRYPQIRYLPLSSLRSLKGTMVTTYQFDPKLRLMSSTGPDGITLRYQYDGLDRLIYSKDGNNNLLQQIRYNYSSL
ncbi:MAG: RHS repeat domain-containing protein, partial [Bacteroidota bacterium]